MASNMHVDQTSCQDRQLEEYEVLKAIYPDFISNSSAFSTDNIIRLKLGIELPSETGFQIFHSTPTYGLTLQATSITLLFLPPILIDVYLPKEYPSCQPPQILSISAEAQWFSKEDALRSTLLDSWQRGETILYSWIEFVRSGQFLRELDPSAGDGNVETIRLVHDVPEILIESLIQHDANARRMAFEKGSYTCAVCLEAHRGTKCVQLSCSHVFCKPCLEEFWTISVREGELTKVRCIDLGCMKSKKETSEEEIQEVLSSTAFSRWKWLKEKREFEKDSDHIYCLVCDGPVKAPDHGQEDGAWTRFRQCSSFHFTFCKVCKRAWHGPTFECPVPLQVLMRYIAAITDNEDDMWRQNTERQFTLWVLDRQVRHFQQEAEKARQKALQKDNFRREKTSTNFKSSEEWLARSTQCCPLCGAYIQRTEGCNTMVCRCGQVFCYACGKPDISHRCVSTIR